MTASRTVNSIKNIKSVFDCPPDKSISVRAIILGAYAQARSRVKNLSLCDDVMSAIDCMRRLGATIELDGATAVIDGCKFKSAKLDCGNSATVARLLTGLLSGVNGEFVLDGDASLRTRPMQRIIDPLIRMGARITSDNGRLPIKMIGGRLCGINYDMPIASAQVKSALLLAGLNSDGQVNVTERVQTRNHTENMLAAMGADITVSDNAVTVGKSKLSALDITVCGDISSAAYPICLALAKSQPCVIHSVGINRTRTAYIDFLRSLGAEISFADIFGGVEPFCDIHIGVSGRLKPFVIDERSAPRMIDEIPALCALACFIDGKSIVSGAEELRFKESDRIKSTVNALKSMGADIEETSDGITVCGGKPLKFGNADSCGDHRIAMSAAIAAAAGGGACIKNADCVSISYKSFFEEVTVDKDGITR